MIVALDTPGLPVVGGCVIAEARGGGQQPFGVNFVELDEVADSVSDVIGVFFGLGCPPRLLAGVGHALVVIRSGVGDRAVVVDGEPVVFGSDHRVHHPVFGGVQTVGRQPRDFGGFPQPGGVCEGVAAGPVCPALSGISALAFPHAAGGLGDLGAYSSERVVDLVGQALPIVGAIAQEPGVKVFDLRQARQRLAHRIGHRARICRSSASAAPASMPPYASAADDSFWDACCITAARFARAVPARACEVSTAAAKLSHEDPTTLGALPSASVPARPAHRSS